MNDAGERWGEGTTLLAALLERFAAGQEVKITRAEIEDLKFGTSHPVEFTVVDDGNAVTMKVVRQPQG